jgi:putative intracellular protease/amidase
MIRATALLLCLAGSACARPQRVSDPAASLAPARVLVVVTSHDRKGEQPSGYFLSEVTHPHRVFRAAGLEVDVVSPKGGRAPVDGFDLADPVNAAFWNEPSTRRLVEETRTPAEIDPSRYAAVFYAGGHAAMWDLPDDAAIARIAAAVHARGGVVGAVCHGPAGLVNVTLADGRPLVAGKEVAAFTDDEERAVGLHAVVPFSLAGRLVERGAKHRPAPDFEANVVVSERLVTGQNPASATGVAEAMVRLLRAAPR